jgi:hypothetical protein
MRGLWDREQPLSPSRLRAAITLLAAFLAALAAFNLINALVQVVQGHLIAALISLTGGLAAPFAIWLGVRMLADMLIVMNRTHDKLEIMAAREARPVAPPVHCMPAADTRPTAERARDDGPVYPEED